MTIAEFLLKLATDPDLLAEFQKDAESAEAVITRAGLTPEQRARLLSGDPRELRVKVKAEFHIDGETVAYSTVYSVPTVYIPPPPPPPTQET